MYFLCLNHLENLTINEYHGTHIIPFGNRLKFIFIFFIYLKIYTTKDFFNDIKYKKKFSKFHSMNKNYLSIV